MTPELYGATYYYPEQSIAGLVTYLKGRKVQESVVQDGLVGQLGTSGEDAISWVNRHISGPGGRGDMTLVVPLDITEGGAEQALHLVRQYQERNGVGNGADPQWIYQASSSPQHGIVTDMGFVYPGFLQAPDNPVHAWANDPQRGLDFGQGFTILGHPWWHVALAGVGVWLVVKLFK